MTPGTVDLILIDADRPPLELLELLVLAVSTLRTGGQILITNIEGTDGEFVGGDAVTPRATLEAYERIAAGRWPITLV
jgi:hypothetical protein